MFLIRLYNSLYFWIFKSTRPHVYTPKSFILQNSQAANLIPIYYISHPFVRRLVNHRAKRVFSIHIIRVHDVSSIAVSYLTLRYFFCNPIVNTGVISRNQRRQATSSKIWAAGLDGVMPRWTQSECQRFIWRCWIINENFSGIVKRGTNTLLVLWVFNGRLLLPVANIVAIWSAMPF